MDGRFHVLRFGSGDTLYAFPETQTSYSDNFSNIVTRTTRLPGVDGGYDEDGLDPAASEAGNINFSFSIKVADSAEMEAKLDAVKAMASWGKQPLFIQPSDSNEDERYVQARVSSINISRRISDNTDLIQPVQMTFSCSYPFWRRQGTEAPTWGGGALWGGGAKWGGNTTPIPLSGLTTTTTVMPGGNSNTLPRLVVSVGAGQSVSGIKIQRMKGVGVLDEVSYTGVLTAGDKLEIDCRAKSVRLNVNDAYGPNFDFKRAQWFALLASQTNSIRVLMDSPSDAANLFVYYYEVFR